MHELGIARGIVDQVRQRVPGQQVTCVRLELGSLAGVTADSLLLCFGLAAAGTSLAGASLEISEVAARCRCRDCGREFTPDGPLPLCPCGGADTEVLAGEGLRITSVQVA